MDTAEVIETRPPSRTQTLSSVFEIDFTRPVAFAILASAFILARLPFVNYGYGTDPDAWRVALTGYYLWEYGEYFPSRLPGNPLHELAIAPFVPLGWAAANLVTALASLAGVYLFARILRHLEMPNQGLLTIGFAFTPLLVINSVSTMDYMWALTFVLGAYYFTLRGAPLSAGLLLGLAVGFRLATAMFGLPLAFILWRQGNFRQVFPLSFATGGIVLLAFAPVLATYGTSFFNYYDEAVGLGTVIRLLGKEALGASGSLAMLIAVALSLGRLKRLPSDVLRDTQVAVWVMVMLLFFFSFLRLPHEIAYLIPVFPFAYLLMGRYFARPVLAGAVAVILIAGLVDITTPGDGLGGPSEMVQARPGSGLLISNVRTMQSQEAFVRDVLTTEVPNHSVVMAGFVYPQLALRARDRLEIDILDRNYEAISMISDRGQAWDRERDIRYVWLLTYDTFMALRSQGYHFFVVPDAVGGTSHLYDYRPQLFGATFLELDRPSPAADPGRASTDR
jgi:hypothetical protein